jgi:hypothetical protein
MSGFKSTTREIHMAAKTYWEKLKDPRWQKKRLEVLQRDEFRCRNCHSESKTLNVHHAFYERGREPWEYDGECLLTLCEECHTRYHRAQNELLRHIAIGPIDAIEEVLGFAKANRTGLRGERNGFRSNQIDNAHQAYGAASRLYCSRPDTRTFSDIEFPITTDDIRAMVLEDFPERERK